MRSAMSAIREDAKRKFILKEKERIITSFAHNPNTKHRAITKVVKRILIDGPYLLNGRMWEVKAKSLGAGVYELSLKLQGGEN